MKRAKLRSVARVRRHKRVRKKVSGSPDRPRLSVFRSNRHIYAQIIDDTQGRVLMSASSMSKELKQQSGKEKGKIAQGKLVGLHLAKVALSKDIKRVVLDRGGYKYSGRLKALAEGAREGGLDF